MKNRRRKLLEPRKEPRQRRARTTVEEVLEAAAQVFERFGCASGTTNRIAKCAGVSIGTLYQYFPNKEAIVVALMERHIAEGARQLNDWVERVVADPRSLRETLEVLVKGMITLHDRRPRLQHILFEETPLPPRVHDALLAGERQAAEKVAGLFQLHSEVCHPRLTEAAIMAVLTVEGLTHRSAAHPDQGLKPEALAVELVDMLEAYLTHVRGIP